LFEDLNKWLRIDDGLEVFKLHGIGGMVGAFLTGIFATAEISGLDGFTFVHGAVDGNGVQVGRQLAEICAIFAWSFVLSVIMLMILKFIPGMHLRVSDDVEEIGLDLDQFDDEVVGEWGNYDTESGHEDHRRHSVMHGVPVAAPASATVETGSMTPVNEEDHQHKVPKEH
jgi:Amt family ammonium transporter